MLWKVYGERKKISVFFSRKNNKSQTQDKKKLMEESNAGLAACMGSAVGLLSQLQLVPICLSLLYVHIYSTEPKRRYHKPKRCTSSYPSWWSMLGCFLKGLYGEN